MSSEGKRRVNACARSLALAAFVLVVGCSSDDTPSEMSGAGTGGSSGAGTGSGGTTSAGMGSGGSSSAGMSSAGMGSGGTTGFAEVGVCGHRGESTVSDTEFDGFEEYFLIGDEGFGDDICIVRFDVTRVGEAPAGCTDCVWSHLVELGNPTTELDENGVCAKSELAFDAARIAELDGSQIAYGFVREFAGHNSVVLSYDDALGSWEPFGNATYDADMERLKFERRNGNCGY